MPNAERPRGSYWQRTVLCSISSTCWKEVHPLHGPPTPHRHDGQGHRPQVVDAGQAPGLDFSLHDGHPSRGGQAECGSRHPLKDRGGRDRTSIRGGLPGTGASAASGHGAARGKYSHHSLKVGRADHQPSSATVRHIQGDPTPMGTCCLPPTHLWPASWFGPSGSLSVCQAFGGKFCVAWPQLRHHGLGANSCGLSKGKSPPPQ